MKHVIRQFSDLPNIGKTLAQKLNSVGIQTEHELNIIESENAIIKISTLENSGVCINMFYAIEGAIQGIRWHRIDSERKEELKEFFKMMNT